MTPVLIIAGREIRDGLRNRWIVAATLLLAGLALALAFLGSAPVGTVGVDRLAVAVVGLSSLTIYLMPLIALMLSYGAVAGEMEQGTMLLLLTYPLGRGEVMLGKFLGHSAILAFATLVGYGVAGASLALGDGVERESLAAFATMALSSVLLGAVFLSIGYLISTLVRERATAASIAVVVWLAFVLLYDLALLGLLLVDRGQVIGAGLFGSLLLANPIDAYRLVNLAGFDHISQFSGLAGLGGQIHVAKATLLALMAGWVALPLAAAITLFRWREL